MDLYIEHEEKEDRLIVQTYTNGMRIRLYERMSVL